VGTGLLRLSALLSLIVLATAAFAATAGADPTTPVFPASGPFVIGDGNDSISSTVTFWGAQWAKNNTLSGGKAPSAFKGFENGDVAPSCPGSWTASPGNSSMPPSGPLPSYMGVIVSSSITKSGASISGDTRHIVVVKTDDGYAPDPGHAGTGTVVALAC